MKNFSIEIKWAVIFFVMMTLWMLMEKMAGLHDENIENHELVTNLVSIPAILIYVLALLDKRKNYYNGFMTYKQGFRTGLIITVILTVLSPLLQFLISEIISPDYFANMIQYSVDNEKLSQAEAEDEFNLKNYMVMATIGTFVMGLITTAIVAIFTRRSRKAV